MAKEKCWVIERQIFGGTDADYAEICRCRTADSVAEVVRAILSSAEPPDRIRLREVPIDA